MNDSFPEGFIPEDQFKPDAMPPIQGGSPAAPSKFPEGFIPEEEFIHQIHPDTALDQAKTAVEQGLSGATLGLSKVLETQGIPAIGVPPISSAFAVNAREKANPITATLSNVAGTAGALALTGGLGALSEGSSLAARLVLKALSGGAIAGVNQATDDWSQNKPLDAQKIAASAGLGAVLGGAGSELGNAANYKIGTPLAKAAKTAVRATIDHTPIGIVLKGAEFVTPDAVKESIEGILNSTSQAFQSQVQKYNGSLTKAVNGLFLGSSAESRK